MAQYEPAIVTFLDVLGFRDLVHGGDADAVDAKLRAVERFTRPSASIDAADPEESFDPLVFQFSDAIVRIRRTRTKWNRERPIGLLFHELLDLVHAQGELVNHGVLIRGGVTYGPVYTSEARVFGPAVVAAYELESRFALYPRIVVDPALLKAFQNDDLLKAAHHDLESEAEYIRKLVRRGDDGIWHVDYLRAVETELDDIALYPEFLMSHRRLIIEGAKRFAGLSSPLSKYMWLASYHNARIGELPPAWFEHFGMEREQLIITSDEMEDLQELRSTMSRGQRNAAGDAR